MRTQAHVAHASRLGQNLVEEDSFFLRKKTDFLAFFPTIYGQRSVMAAWPTRSPWSILFRLLLLTHFGESPMCEIIFSAFYSQRSVTAALATRSPWSILLISI